MREAEHAVDIVFDDQHGNVGRDVLHEVRDALALGGGEAGQRFVQQQHLRLGAERDAEIDQPLSAIGKFTALDGLDAFEAEEFDQFSGLGVDALVAVDVAPEIEPHVALRLQRQSQIFVNRKTLEQVGDLERAGQALMADQIGWHALNLAAVELDGAFVGRKKTRDQIEQGGLASAVRADQRVDFTGTDGEARIVDGADAAKALGNAVHLQHGAGEPLRHQEGRQRQAFVDLAPAHRCGFLRRRPPAFAEAGPDADQPVRREQHERHEDQSEP